MGKRPPRSSTGPRRAGRARALGAALVVALSIEALGTAAAQPGAPDPPTASSAPPASPPSATAPYVPPPPGADQIQFAAREHDLGYRAYVDKQFDEAASHFENAFFAAPNPAEIRSAIRARRDAGEIARAATLAAIALRRFPNDAATAKVANDTIVAARPRVYEVVLASNEEYSAAIDEKIVSSERVKESRVFMSAGTHDLMLSWSDGRNERVAIQATDGGSETLHLDPPAPAPPVATVTPPPPSTASVVAPPPTPPPEAPPATKPLDPPVFITGAALTGVALGFMIWSGINTEVDPGRDAVIADCMGQGVTCQTYQTGLDHQHRTDVLIGVTSVLAVATAVVGVFFTQWSPVRPTTATPASPLAPRGEASTPAGALAPRIGVGPAGLEGTF